MDKRVVVEEVKRLVAPLLKSRQVELVDLTYQYGGRRSILRFLVDTAQGVRLDELSALNHAISAVLDEKEVVPGSYTLEVSSPGLDRLLTRAADFERVIGRRLRVITSEPLEGEREHAGELLSAGEEAVVLRLDSGQKRRIALAQIARAKQEIRI